MFVILCHLDTFSLPSVSKFLATWSTLLTIISGTSSSSCACDVHLKQQNATLSDLGHHSLQLLLQVKLTPTV
jgi:hypothetical protein